MKESSKNQLSNESDSFLDDSSIKAAKRLQRLMTTRSRANQEMSAGSKLLKLANEACARELEKLK